MSDQKKIKTALVSVFHKDGLDEIIKKLNAEGVQLLSTGGTQNFIESLGVPCNAVEDLTTYPSILGGRVKTLHPKVFGGILGRRDNEGDREQMAQYEIPEIDLVIVDLYPFEQTVASGADFQSIIEKIDIGGISLIRAAAKNFKDVVIVASKAQYKQLANMLEEAQQMVREEKDKYLRLSAEFDNYRKRTLKEKAELIKNGGEKTLTAILPVLDDFERALKNMETSEETKAMKEGVELIFNKFQKILGQEGLQKIETEGKEFDTDFHEAIALIPAPSEDLKGKILDCVQTGYMLNEKVIRHAKVAVAQ